MSNRPSESLATQVIGSAGSDDASATRIDSPVEATGGAGHAGFAGGAGGRAARGIDSAAIPPEVAGPAVFAKQTVVMAPLVARKGAAPSPSIGPAPEISLTSHELPADEKVDPRLALVLDPDSERAAAFRVLRHHLLEAGRPQVIVVSSALPTEGKTTVAANLALALAECGRAKVLLAEAHVRRPQLANVFRCIPPWCFAEQLAAHRAQPGLPWNIIEIASLWLHVAPLNPRIDRAQLLDGPAFSAGMDRLRLAGYDHIVIDAPPVLGSADVNLMADAADGVLLAARANRTTSRDLRKSFEQLGRGKVLGTVLVQ